MKLITLSRLSVSDLNSLRIISNDCMEQSLTDNRVNQAGFWSELITALDKESKKRQNEFEEAIKGYDMEAIGKERINYVNEN